MLGSALTPWLEFWGVLPRFWHGVQRAARPLCDPSLGFSSWDCSLHSHGQRVAFPPFQELLGLGASWDREGVPCPWDRMSLEVFSNPNHSMVAAGMAKGNWGDQSGMALQGIVESARGAWTGNGMGWEGQGSTFPALREQPWPVETQRHLQDLGSFSRGVLVLLQEGSHPK